MKKVLLAVFLLGSIGAVAHAQGFATGDGGVTRDWVKNNWEAAWGPKEEIPAPQAISVEDLSQEEVSLIFKVYNEAGIGCDASLIAELMQEGAYVGPFKMKSKKDEELIYLPLVRAVSSKNEKSLDVINTLEAGTDSYVYAQANVHGQMQTPMAIARRAINGKEVTSLEVRKLIRLLEIAQAKNIIQRDDKKLLKKLQRQVRSFEMKQNFQKLLGEGVALSPHVRR